MFRPAVIVGTKKQVKRDNKIGVRNEKRELPQNFTVLRQLPVCFVNAAVRHREQRNDAGALLAALLVDNSARILDNSELA